MRFLIDEDVDIAVGGMLADRHEVRYVTQELGSGTKDPAVERYADTQRLVLVTGDRSMANRLHQDHLRDGRRVECLFLKALYDRESARVAALLDVIEAEHAILGPRFWMEIAESYYRVLR